MSGAQLAQCSADSTIFIARRRTDAVVEKEPGCFQAAVSASVEECRLELFWIGFWPTHAVFVEVRLQHVEPAHRRRTFAVQGRAVLGKKPGGSGLSIRNAAVNDGVMIASRRDDCKVRPRSSNVWSRAICTPAFSGWTLVATKPSVVHPPP